MLLVRVGIALSGLCLTACSGCSHSSPSTDGDGGGYEGRPKDAAADGFISDQGDAADAGVDTGVNPFVGQWNLVGDPMDCSMRVAQDPAHSIPPLGFAPCKSGRVGCQTLVVDWWSNLGGLPTRRTIDFRRGSIARVIGGRPFLLYSRVYPNPNETIRDFFVAYVSVLQPIDAAPVFASGSFTSDNCASWTTFGDDGIAYLSSSGSGPAELLAWTPWTSPTSFSTKIIQRTQWGADHAQSVVISAGHLYVETVNPFSVDVFDLATQSLLLAKVPQRLNAGSPIPVPDGALVLDGNAPYHADLLRPDATYSSLILPTSPHQLTWAAVDRSASNAFVWVESDFGGRAYVNPVLWTAPYAARALDLVPRKVAVVTDMTDRGGGDMVVNAGVALNIVGLSTALLTRLSDGMGWTINAEPGEAFIRPVWVDDNEIWLSTGDASRPDYSAHTGGVMRLKRSSLGAPTVPRGY